MATAFVSHGLTGLVIKANPFSSSSQLCEHKVYRARAAITSVKRHASLVMSTAHGHGASSSPHGDTSTDRRPGAHKGFVEEMRFVAMRLHTKDQAPKEGKMEESALPIQEWRPKQEDFLQFLVDSKFLYDFMEGHMAASKNPMLNAFANTGLERSLPLKKDIEFFTMQGFAVPQPTQAATNYVNYLDNLLKTKPHAFLCHWYNTYFAHTAGGRMIGKMMTNLLFGGKEFEFYKWEKDVKEILGEVREKIDLVAKDWPREVKDECLNETGLAFGYSGTILRNLAKV